MNEPKEPEEALTFKKTLLIMGMMLLAGLPLILSLAVATYYFGEWEPSLKFWAFGLVMEVPWTYLIGLWGHDKKP